MLCRREELKTAQRDELLKLVCWVIYHMLEKENLAGQLKVRKQNNSENNEHKRLIQNK